MSDMDRTLTAAELGRLIRAYNDWVPISLLVDRFSRSAEIIRMELAKANVQPRARTAEAD